MPRFVILEHDHPVLHWDLMLEAGDVLHTWRLPTPPQAHGHAIEATALSDHRRMYLDYEGPVRGNRGIVRRWDAGSFDEEASSTPEARLLRFHGVLMKGCWRLERMVGASWQLASIAPTEPAPS
jgi:hypothetical protein